MYSLTNWIGRNVSTYMWGGGGDRGVWTSRFPYPLIPVPALYFLAPALCIFSIAKHCAMLRNFPLFLPLPAPSSPTSRTPPASRTANPPKLLPKLLPMHLLHCLQIESKLCLDYIQIASWLRPDFVLSTPILRLTCAQTASRLPLDCIEIASRLRLDCILTAFRMCPDCF